NTKPPCRRLCISVCPFPNVPASAACSQLLLQFPAARHGESFFFVIGKHCLEFRQWRRGDFQPCPSMLCSQGPYRCEQALSRAALPVFRPHIKFGNSTESTSRINGMAFISGNESHRLCLALNGFVNGNEGLVSAVGKIDMQALLGLGQIEAESMTSDPVRDIRQQFACHERHFTSVAGVCLDR